MLFQTFFRFIVFSRNRPPFFGVESPVFSAFGPLRAVFSCRVVSFPHPGGKCHTSPPAASRFSHLDSFSSSANTNTGNSNNRITHIIIPPSALFSSSRISYHKFLQIAIPIFARRRKSQENTTLSPNPGPNILKLPGFITNPGGQLFFVYSRPNSKRDSQT